MPEFNEFRINKILLEDIKEIRLNNPDLDFETVKLAPYIQSTYVPNNTPSFNDILLDYYTGMLNMYLSFKNFNKVNFYIDKKKELAIKLRKIMFEKIAEIKKRVESYSNEELETQLKAVDELIFHDFNDMLTLTESNMLIQEAIKRNLILY